MATTAGALSLISVASTTASVSSAVATGGATLPYTYQWYKSTTTGFTPGGGNIINGATALLLNDSGLTPGTQYFYKMVSTDSSSPTVSATSTSLNVASSQPVLDPNQFQLQTFLGVADMRENTDTVSVEIDVSQSGSLYAGMAVKMVDSADGVPKVIGCAANADNVFGFLNYDIKSKVYVAGSKAECSISGNFIYLYATGAIARMARVSLDLSTNGGVASITTGANVVGYAYDKASAAGQLIRVKLITPSYLTAP